VCRIIAAAREEQSSRAAIVLSIVFARGSSNNQYPAEHRHRGDL
jgi:hypothetical protein